MQESERLTAGPEGAFLWVLVADVVPERPWTHPHTGTLEWRNGTKHFSGGTKVYCSEGIGSTGIGIYGCVHTLGRARRSKRWIDVVTAVKSLQDFRVKREFHPHVLKLLSSNSNFVNVGDAESHRLRNELLAERANEAANEAAKLNQALRHSK